MKNNLKKASNGFDACELAECFDNMEKFAHQGQVIVSRLTKTGAKTLVELHELEVGTYGFQLMEKLGYRYVSEYEAEDGFKVFKFMKVA